MSAQPTASQPSSSGARVALVTGASAGFGAAITRRMVAAGYRVVAAARRVERLDALRAELGDAVHPVALDVRDAEAVHAVVAGLPEDLAALDVVVGNAGLALGMGPAQEASWADWEQMIDTNVRGLAATVHAVLPGMVARRRGHVVVMGSVAGTYPYPGGHVYGGSKAFAHQLALALRSDLHGTGVRVTTIEAGMVAGTEFSRIRFGGDESRVEATYRDMQPLTAEDIAETVAWVTSQPPHVNVNVVEVMPTTQSFAPFQVHRG
ncbi:malonic semialdehyde reductase [Actinotalea ferrariae CF5-4]|uniref:Malonic semialdehyde reductase n=1 Tax=Actinotalea ferrariae CF5-4 TaxID=948458 RepID=A0A021VVK8_9CELL|nr:SDR family NAD(P)-dependent oxidoreductase [Actinotalea ferrariae]EYR65153.1 malonic semialdehyde reductase [Actinotalea ferrariae CF5-4]